MDCELLTTNIGACTDKVFKGFEQEILWGNRSEIDWENTTYDTATGLITEIAMVSGKTMHLVTVTALKPFSEFKITGEQKDLGILFKNEVAIKLKGLNPTNAVLVNTLSKGEFFGILPQQGVGIDAKYVAIGVESGLKATTPEFTTEMGAWNIPFTEEMCDGAGLFVYVGVAGVGTEAAIEALKPA